MAEIVIIEVLEKGVCLKDFDIQGFKQPLELGEILHFSLVCKAEHKEILKEDWMLVVESEDNAKKGGGLCKEEFDFCMQFNTFKKIGIV
ncbi:hypothetical protein HN784_04710 [bacterium]|jgi:hypothetical protein|nr:hypothetical protein [bacterium]MBT4251476.1 hypothetical protein [bacterium]MBT4597450.1 hypothetical protein [bacterium]MBT6754289.1 hypothetical protein [bacterium]MBT7037615.1 hypothetical protein [bacterium]